MADATLQVQICYAKPEAQFLYDLAVPAGTTLRGALERSGVLQAHPEIDLAACRVGIFGKLKEFDTILRDHDRVEVYRPLIADPKEARRRRVRKKESNAKV